MQWGCGHEIVGLEWGIPCARIALTWSARRSGGSRLSLGILTVLLHLRVHLDGGGAECNEEGVDL
jgi:hypothetical protein